MKTELRFTLDGQKLRRIDDNTVASNAVNVPTAVFENLREDEWSGYDSYTAEFKNGNTVICVPLVGTNECAVPHEVLVPGTMCVTVYAESVEGEEISASITSTEAEVRIERGPSKHGDNSRAPTADEVAVVKSVAEAAATGKFNGTPATVMVGTVESIAASENASVANSGTVNDAVFDFKLPRGRDGESLYALGTLDELKERCIHNTLVGSNGALHTVWCGEDTEVTATLGNITLRAGNIYRVVYRRSADSILYTNIQMTKAIGDNTDPYSASKELVSRFMTKGRKTASSSKEVDIILFAGQSNSCGRAIPSDKSSELDVFSTVDISKAFTYHDATVKNQLDTTPQPIVEPILANGTVEGGVATFRGYVSTFLNAYYATTGRRVCACFKSYGGQMLNKWLPYTVDSNGNELPVTDSSAYYNQMLSYINHAKSRIQSDPELSLGNIYLVWCQGEADAEFLGKTGDNTNVIEQALSTDEEKKAYYKTSFMRMLDKLKTDVGMEKAFIIRIGHFGKNDMSNTRNAVIIEAQNELCREEEDCVMVSGLFAGAKVFREEDGSVRNLMRDNSHYLPEGYFRAGIEAGTNAGIYVNTGTKPILLDYHRLYLEQLNAEDDTFYERNVDKYIYDPERVDIGTMLKFTDHTSAEKPEEPDVPDIPDEPVDDGYIINLDFSTGKELSDYADVIKLPDDLSGISYNGGLETNGNLTYGLELITPISLDNAEGGSRSWTVEFGATLPSTASAETDYRFAIFSTDNETDTSKFSPALICQGSTKNIQLRTGYGANEVSKGISDIFIFDGNHHDYKFVYDGDYMTPYVDGTEGTKKQFGSAVKNGADTNGAFGRVFGVYSGYTSNAASFGLSAGTRIAYLRMKEGTA